MLNFLIPLACAIGCFLAAQRSLKFGLCAVLTVGYLYGITRANIGGYGTYLMFDVSAIALYASQLLARTDAEQQARLRELRFWTISLIIWPTLLFVIFLVFPNDEPAVELVGLRANVFLLPFLLLGGRLDADDIRDVAIFCAVLNLGAVALGAAEFVLGIERFYPMNETTEIIYRSHDLLDNTAHRIPGSFVNAHAFAGTLAVTLPLILGAWSQPHERRWAGPLLAAAAVASFVGIFMAATRTHMITAAGLAVMMSLTGGLSKTQWVRWAFALLLVGYVVSGDVRLQRFTTLTEEGTLSDRVGGSVNADLLDVVTRYPLGDGLASGGTSVPFFLRSTARAGMLIENEYARISVEQGIPGLLLWAFFVLWVAIKFPRRAQDPWLLGRRLAWAACLSIFLSGMLGIGMMASVPQTSVMLLLIGWFTTAPRLAEAEQEEHLVAATDPAPVPLRRVRPARRRVASPGRSSIDFDWTPPRS